MANKTAQRIRNIRNNQKHNGRVSPKRKRKLIKARARYKAFLHKENVQEKPSNLKTMVKGVVNRQQADKKGLDLSLRWHIVDNTGFVLATEKSRDKAREVNNTLKGKGKICKLVDSSKK